MKPTEKKQFLCLLAMLAEAFKEEISKERAKIYFEFLREFEIEKIQKSIRMAIETLKFFPKIAELRDFIIEPINRNENYWPEFKEIEYSESALSTEKAKELLREIQNRIGMKEIKPTLEGEAAKEFERKRKIAKEKTKGLIN